jgi:glyoxylase-like metal-dependent hydrolase (beta-lactamase superfamily II)
VLNTHLHSDHCGGNAALQARWPVQTRVPAASHAAVAQWDEDRLSYRPSGQHCPRFAVDGVLVPGSQVRLGPTDWQVLAAPGHDPDAILLFEPQTRTLIAGDALWQNRLAVIFPELVEASGFAETRATLDLIERLAPRWVIPGHGEPFEDVAEALAGSRSRLSAFEADPRHARHAARALLMFHLMELGGSDAGALQRWIVHTPLFVAMARQLGASDLDRWATGLIDSLVGDGLVRRENARLQLVPRTERPAEQPGPPAKAGPAPSAATIGPCPCTGWSSSWVASIPRHRVITTASTGRRPARTRQGRTASRSAWARATPTMR